MSEQEPRGAEGISRLSEILERLLALDEAGDAEGKEWGDLVAEVQSRVRGDRALDRRLPHAFWHFVADADIRSRDREYAEQQRAQIQRWLEEVR